MEGRIVSLAQLEREDIERKQARRWRDIQRDIPTPLMDQVLKLGPSAIPNKAAWKRLLRVAAYLDTHLQRAGAAHDLPNTHTAYLDSFQALLAEYQRGS